MLKKAKAAPDYFVTLKATVRCPPLFQNGKEMFIQLLFTVQRSLRLVRYSCVGFSSSAEQGTRSEEFRMIKTRTK